MKCSVILPTYFSQETLEETLESVFRQTYQDFELLICDDGSNDGTIDIIKRYQEKYTNIHLYQNERNRGVGNTLFNLFQKASGRFVAMIGHDDVWAEEYLAKQIKNLLETKAMVSFSNVVFIDGKNCESDDYIFKNQSVATSSRHELFANLIKGNFLCAPSSVIDQEKLDGTVLYQLLGYNNDRLQDYELWLNLLLLGEFSYCADTTCYYRVHGNNYSIGKKRLMQGKYEFVVTLRRVFYKQKFLDFIIDYKRPKDIEEHFLLHIFNHLEHNITYSKLLIELIPELGEHLLTHHISEVFIHDYLAKYYNELGLLTKTKTNYENRLYKKISLYIYGNSSKIAKLLNDQYVEIVDSIDRHTIVFVEDKLLEMALNEEKILSLLHSKQVVLYGESEELDNSSNLSYFSLDEKFNFRLLQYAEDILLHFYHNEFYVTGVDNYLIADTLEFIYVESEHDISHLSFLNLDKECEVSFYDENFKLVEYQKDVSDIYRFLDNSKKLYIKAQKIDTQIMIYLNNQLYSYEITEYLNKKMIGLFKSRGFRYRKITPVESNGH